jgi:hypothetical protein
MDLVIQRNADIKQKIIKKVVAVDTALLNTFRYTFCRTDKRQCLAACASDGSCVPTCDGQSNNVSHTKCNKECAARNNFKNLAFPIDSANFMMDTPDKVHKALTMEVTHISLPCKIYNISQELRNNYFRVNTTIFEIPPGMYTIQELVNVMSIAVRGRNIRFYYDSVIDRVYILKMAVAPVVDDIIDFTHLPGCLNLEHNTTLGWALGFRLPVYSMAIMVGAGPSNGINYQDLAGATQDNLAGNWPDQKYTGSIMPLLRGDDADGNSLTGAPILDYALNNWRDHPGGTEADPATVGVKGGVESTVQRQATIEGIVAEASPSLKMDYVYMVVDEFNRNKNDEYMTSANKFSNVLAKIPLINTIHGISVDNVIFREINRKRTYFSPINIEKLNVKFLDRFGRKIDLGINTINTTIEFECAYS